MRCPSRGGRPRLRHIWADQRISPVAEVPLPGADLARFLRQAQVFLPRFQVDNALPQLVQRGNIAHHVLIHS